MGNPVFAADNRWDDVGAIATSTPSAATAFPIANVFDDRLFTFFQPLASALSVTITNDLDGPLGDVNYISIMSHNINTAAFGSGIFTFQRFRFGQWLDVLADIPITDDRIIFHEFAQTDGEQFRITITTVGGATSILPSIGQLQWGLKVQPDGFIQVGFDPESEQVRGRFTRSQVGNILGAISTVSTRFADINIPFLTNTFIRDNTVGGFKDFWDNHASKLKPFVFSWNPGNPGIFEKDAFFGLIQPESGIARPLSTNLDAGFRSLQFRVEGLKE